MGGPRTRRARASEEPASSPAPTKKSKKDVSSSGKVEKFLSRLASILRESTHDADLTEESVTAALKASVADLSDSLSIKPLLAADISSHAETLCKLLGVGLRAPVHATPKSEAKTRKATPAAKRKGPAAPDVGLLTDSAYASSLARCAKASRADSVALSVSRCPPPAAALRAAAGLATSSTRGKKDAALSAAAEAQALCQTAHVTGIASAALAAASGDARALWASLEAFAPAVDAIELAVSTSASQGGPVDPAVRRALAGVLSSLLSAAQHCHTLAAEPSAAHPHLSLRPPPALADATAAADPRADPAALCARSVACQGVLLAADAASSAPEGRSGGEGERGGNKGRQPAWRSACCDALRHCVRQLRRVPGCRGALMGALASRDALKDLCGGAEGLRDEAWLLLYMGATTRGLGMPDEDEVECAAKGMPVGDRPADFFARVICARRAAEALRSLGHAGEASGVLSRASRRGMPDGLSEWLGSQPPSAVVELLLGAVEGGVGEVYKACWDRIGESQLRALLAAAGGEEGDEGAEGEGGVGSMDGELLFFADKGGESNFKEMAEWSSDDEAEEEGEDAEKGGVDIREVMKGGDASDSGSESGDESE